MRLNSRDSAHHSTSVLSEVKRFLPCNLIKNLALCAWPQRTGSASSGFAVFAFPPMPRYTPSSSQDQRPGDHRAWRLWRGGCGIIRYGRVQCRRPTSGVNSVGRVPASQAGCRGFEPRTPLQPFPRSVCLNFPCRCAASSFAEPGNRIGVDCGVVLCRGVAALCQREQGGVGRQMLRQ